MTLVASLVHPVPGQLHAFLSAGDRLDLLRRRAERQRSCGAIARRRPESPHHRGVRSARMGAASRPAMDALVERLLDASPVDPKICGEDRYYWSKDIEQMTSPGEEAAAALVAIGSDSLPLLTAAPHAHRNGWRAAMPWALGALRDGRGVSPALMALADREAPVRRVAAWALGALDADVAVTALIDALGDPGRERSIAGGLGARGDSRRSSHRRVDQSVEGSEENVRMQAAWALGAIRDRRASDALAAALKDSSPRVRRQAAWAPRVNRTLVPLPSS